MPSCNCLATLCGYAEDSDELLPPPREKKPDPADPAATASDRLATFSSAMDRDHQVVQWRRGIKRQFGRLNRRTAELLLDLCENDDLQSTIVYLDAEYKRQGLAAGIRLLESTLESLNSFSGALCCLAQAGPEPVQLLWGSTLLLIKVRRISVMGEFMRKADGRNPRSAHASPPERP
jgi:hypothetical protein